MDIEQVLPTIISAIVVAAALAGGALYFISAITQTEVTAQLASEEMARVSATHLIEACLNAQGRMSEPYLDSLSGKTVCEACRSMFPSLCKLGIKASVEDFNTGKKWVLGDFEEPDYEIWVNIAREGGLDAGKLYVET